MDDRAPTFLRRLDYNEFADGPQTWTLKGLELGGRNLIVGKNATGKTRTINVINALSEHLSGKRPAGASGHFQAEFRKGPSVLTYSLRTAASLVLEETLEIDEKRVLTRREGGVGEIRVEGIAGVDQIAFQTPPHEIAVAARRDTIQHPFLEPLHRWASSVRTYRFGTPLGKDHWAVITPVGAIQPDERDQNQAVGLFRKGQKDYGLPFVDAVLDDFRSLGYEVERVEAGPQLSMRIVSDAPVDLLGLNVKENDLAGITDQFSMSTGMFRALALFVHLNYCKFSGRPSTILVDDIGEGLDFDRSCRLIERLRTKTDDTIQLVLASNDRFVMNQVPLEEWSVLERSGPVVEVKNHNNSKSVFEAFKFTGLSNFSFLEMDALGEDRRESLQDEETRNLR